MNLENKKIKNNKGFSLVELLAAMIILSIIGVITIVGVTRYINSSKEQKTTQNKKNVSLAAELYLQANRDLYPKLIGEKKRIQLSELRNANYIKEDVTDEQGYDCMKESYVLVTKLAENEYSYITQLYCGDQKAPKVDKENPPYLETITVDGKSGKIVFSKSDEVKTANFSFTLVGQEGNPGIKIASYAYIILGKTSLETEYTELYNSGIIDGNNKTRIEFKSRALGNYIDLAGVTDIKVKVTALNERGGYLSYDVAMDEANASGSETYEDTEDPICPPIHEYGSRLGEPQSFDDWVSKRDIGTERYPRIVTIKCDDGNGSGCKRDTFSEAWPNINEEEQRYGVMFGYVIIQDNAVINDKGVKKEQPNKAKCDINVLVDLQAPTIEITPYNPAPTDECDGERCPNKVATRIVYNDKAYPDSSTIIVNDPTDPLTGNVVNPSLTIDSTNYLNMYNNGANVNEGWLNNTYYPEGIQYKVKISDNLYLDSYTWEVNNRWHETNSSTLHEIYSVADAEHPEAKSWNRREDPNDEMYVDEALLFEQKENYKFSNEKEFVINFYDEGARYGVLTVRDRAGNETKVYIHANLDRTEPPVDEGQYDFLSFNRLNINEDEPLKYVDENLDGELDYQYEDWEGLIRDPNKDDRTFSGWTSLSQSKIFKDYSTMTECLWCDDDRPGGDYPDFWVPYGYRKYQGVCYPQTENGYGIIQGTEYDEEEINTQYGRERTGCYKVGVLEGDNQFSGREVPDYEDPDVFRELILTGQEYKSGTWTNEELVCGPHEDSTYDTLVTERLPDGTFRKIQNPNGEEISKWGGMRINYYPQIGVVKDKNNPGKMRPVQSKQPTKKSVITKRDRSQWPRYTEQGTHKLKWSNCDAAGNCSGFRLEEYIRIDTIAPQCNNSVRYNDELNSDGTTGPNHNGWLYDKQAATVYHDCADTSNMEYDDYFSAYNHLKFVTQAADANLMEYYDEYGSGCTNFTPTTDEMVYDKDVYTCSAGTDGIGSGRLGKVADYAGNERQCKVGATVRKDTRPPICSARAYYEGKNGDGKYNQPNKHGWAIGGMSIYTKKSCEDTLFAIGGPGELSYEGATNYAISGCTYADDYEFSGLISRVQSTHKGINTAEIDTTTINGETYIYPNNNTKFYLDDDKDIEGNIGSSAPELDDEGNTVFRNGYVVDRAGNVSDSSCMAVWVGRDSEVPNCTNALVSPNNMYAVQSHVAVGNGQYVDTYTPQKASPWVDEATGKKWVGSSGADGNKEYAQVQKGCEDKGVPNYPGITYPEEASSGCDHYLDPQNNVWYYGQKETDKNNISWVNDGEVKKWTNATYLGPQDKPIFCDNEVYDDAGNHGGGEAKAIEVNVDYVDPVCGNIDLYQTASYDISAGPKRIFYNGLWRDSASRPRELYNQPPGEIGTSKYVVSFANCGGDEGSGCLPYNGRVVMNDVPYQSWEVFEYLGKDSDQFTTVYAFDIARNKTACTRTFSLKQDRQVPIIQSCTYKAHYSKDKAPDSYIEVTITGIEDPPAAPDNYASGIDLKNSYLNNGRMLMSEAKHHYGEFQWFFYYDENVRGAEFSRLFANTLRSRAVQINGGIYSTGSWYSWFPTNYKLDHSEDYTDRDSTVQINVDGSTYVKSPLTCTNYKNKPFPLVRLQDLAGNVEEYPCSPETPEDDILIPACCDEVVGEETCNDWQWSTCTKKCDTGTQYEYRTCEAESKYRDGKMCPYRVTQNEGTLCNEQACCSKVNTNCPGGCQNGGFENDNPCSFGQQQCESRSSYDNNIVCTPNHIETCQINKEQCEKDIAEAKTAGNETAIEIARDIEYYQEEEKWYYDEETDKDYRLYPLISNGRIVPFEYYTYNDYGAYIPVCDLQTAKQYLKDEYKNDDSIINCSQITEDMYNVDAQNHLFKSIALYNYIASPSSCQLWIDRVVRSDWVAFKAADTKNCKIQSGTKYDVNNCNEKVVNDTTIHALISRKGEYNELEQHSFGCNIIVEWENSHFVYTQLSNFKYKKQSYVAYKCENHLTGKVEYCLDSCASGTCVNN